MNSIMTLIKRNHCCKVLFIKNNYKNLIILFRKDFAVDFRKNLLLLKTSSIPTLLKTSSTFFCYSFFLKKNMATIVSALLTNINAHRNIEIYINYGKKLCNININVEMISQYNPFGIQIQNILPNGGFPTTSAYGGYSGILP